jgi:hypothetical protein
MRKTLTVAGIRMGLSPTALLPSRLKPPATPLNSLPIKLA